MKFLWLILIVFITGCQTAGMEYYQAVEKVAIAQAQAQQAKADALSKIAASSDSSAAGSAVMALALMQTPNTQIIPQQSAALEWSKAVLPVVGSLGAMWISSDAQKSTARYAMQSNLARINQEGNKTTALYELLGNNNDNMLNLGLGGFDAVNEAGAQSVELGLGLGLASINGGSGGTDNSNAILNAINGISWPDYSTNFQEILDAIGGITIPNYSTELADILSRLTAGTTTWVPGVNCISPTSGGVISVGSSGSTLPVCPN